MMIVHTCPSEQGKKSYKFSLTCDHCGEIITDANLGWSVWIWPIKAKGEYQAPLQTVHDECLSDVIESIPLEAGFEWAGCHTAEMSRPEGANVGRIRIAKSEEEV